MKRVIIFIILLTITIFPGYAQTQSNPSISIETLEIPSEKFNVVSSDANIITLEHEHAINWQLTIENNLVYANPLGNAVMRLYDNLNKEKFVEIGMGSQPDFKFWVAVQTPDTGYAVIHSRIEDGWKPGKHVTAAYSDTTGFSVNNGERIVVSNLDVENFVIKEIAVYGMESSTDPYATNSGSLLLNVVSGNPAANPLFYLPFILAGTIGVLVVILLKIKKRV
ncbi:MAG: hypothetical protein ACT4N1_02275 [Nitrososphaerota archaeon]